MKILADLHRVSRVDGRTTKFVSQFIWRVSNFDRSLLQAHEIADKLRSQSVQFFHRITVMLSLLNFSNIFPAKKSVSGNFEESFNPKVQDSTTDYPISFRKLH